jgi:hypothetical protein
LFCAKNKDKSSDKKSPLFFLTLFTIWWGIKKTF